MELAAAAHTHLRAKRRQQQAAAERVCSDAGATTWASRQAAADGGAASSAAAAAAREWDDFDGAAISTRAARCGDGAMAGEKASKRVRRKGPAAEASPSQLHDAGFAVGKVYRMAADGSLERSGHAARRDAKKQAHREAKAKGGASLASGQEGDGSGARGGCSGAPGAASAVALPAALEVDPYHGRPVPVLSRNEDGRGVHGETRAKEKRDKEKRRKERDGKGRATSGGKKARREQEAAGAACADMAEGSAAQKAQVARGKKRKHDKGKRTRECADGADTAALAVEEGSSKDGAHDPAQASSGGGGAGAVGPGVAPSTVDAGSHPADLNSKASKDTQRRKEQRKKKKRMAVEGVAQPGVAQPGGPGGGVGRDGQGPARRAPSVAFGGVGRPAAAEGDAPRPAAKGGASGRGSGGAGRGRGGPGPSVGFGGRGKAQYPYGNYDSYYSYRLVPNHLGCGSPVDARLGAFRREWFLGKDVCDIGCNAGLVSAAVARVFGVRSMLGLDIDAALVKKASGLVATQGAVALIAPPEGGGSAAAPPPVASATCDAGPSAPPMLSNSDFRQLFSLAPGLGGGAPGAGAVAPGAGAVPRSFGMCLGGAREPAEPFEPGAPFPHCVRFRHCNIVQEPPSEGTPGTGDATGAFDTVLCLSTAKWVHLHFGDTGLLCLFRRAHAALRPGGRMLLEPQPWSSYRKNAGITPHVLRNYGEIEIKPPMFREVLLGQIGFRTCEEVEVPSAPAGESAGFAQGARGGAKRPLFLLTK